MAVLITGGSGFVGLNVVERLLRRGEAVVVYAANPLPEPARHEFSKLPGRLSSVVGDVRDASAVAAALRGHGADRVIHAAAVTAGRERERGEARAVVEVNALGTVAVLEAARRQEVRRFVFVSSNAVYGRGPFAGAELDEIATCPAPATLYAITKYMGERTSLLFKSDRGLDVVVARLGSVFGPWEYETGVRDTLSAPLRVVRLGLAGRAAVLSDPGLRDWLYAPDAAAGLVALLDLAQPRHAVYNVGSGRRWTVDAWCRRLEALMPGLSHRVAADSGEANVDLFGVPDRPRLAVARLAADTGFRARFGLEESAVDFAAWIDRHREFVG